MNALIRFVFPLSAHSHFPSTKSEHIHCHLSCLHPESESIPNLPEGMKSIAIWLACCKGFLSAQYMHKGRQFDQAFLPAHSESFAAFRTDFLLLILKISGHHQFAK